MALQHSDISRMLEVAVVAARLAGQRAMEEIKYQKTSIKNGNEIVTSADPICQNLIIERIKATFPDHGFIAEEGPNDKPLFQPPRSVDDIWWVIDPIDGTNNYSHGLLDFGVSIAVMHQGKPIVGVIFAPATDSMFTAAIEGEAQLNASHISTSDEAMSEFSSLGIDSHFTDDMAPAMHKVIQKTRFRNLGACTLHLAAVANGAFIGTITTLAKIWDIAAGALIIETAGGIVTYATGKEIFPVDMQTCTTQNYKMIAANKKNHGDLIKIFKAE